MTCTESTCTYSAGYSGEETNSRIQGRAGYGREVVLAKEGTRKVGYRRSIKYSTPLPGSVGTSAAFVSPQCLPQSSSISCIVDGSPVMPPNTRVSPSQ